ncbi:MAG: hypothetical protein IKT46_07675 [Clostridia bacterium]|nr:hypothetical protein [Clostridia bacterium]
MLNKITKYTKTITYIMIGIFAILWILTLIFADMANKLQILILSAVLLLVLYGMFRFMYKMLIPSMSLWVMKLYLYFFIIVPTIFCVADTVSFVIEFPNGLTPTLGACIGVIAATLHTAKKNMPNYNKKISKSP